MFERIARWYIKRKEVKHLCQRIIYAFTENDLTPECKMAHNITGVTYIIEIYKD